MITLLDGPLGTELEARGVPPVRDCWSAEAIETAPDMITAIHRDYAQKGCVVHTTNTFEPIDGQAAMHGLNALGPPSN